LRTGCMCNLSGVAALLGIEDGMKNAEEGRIMWEGMTLWEFEEEVEHEWKKRELGLNHSRVGSGGGRRWDLVAGTSLCALHGTTCMLPASVEEKIWSDMVNHSVFTLLL
jgi:hypothetical protein